jgi:hypothetical protein
MLLNKIKTGLKDSSSICTPENILQTKQYLQ